MIIPAFDLINGKPVRLYQGNYLNQKDYNVNLRECLEEYKLKGIKIVHLVDLDGAKNSKNRQLNLLKKILSYGIIPIQIGGGIRNIEDIQNLLDCGATRVIIGSCAIKNKIQVKKWLDIYGPDRIVLALDVHINNNKKEIHINGWQKKTNYFLEDIIEYFSSSQLKHVLCTDISKDGTLSGPNFKLYQDLVKNFKNIKFQASGGVSVLNDIVSLKKTGVHNVIIGRSLLEKKFTIEDALKCWQNES
ncbi:1-(5-phosphoribosyl)-5-[(5-phosphoribosylamino)methylideneamino]imidazole-4-carboxamide isomerase [Buchnera aphidicola (Hyadaphis tataricae)]|uniref:1-(5-phosphoribosyl)-5-[(5-phosphoribosylamino)methylideneamino] imidazole-4-carboxamide isomerase n=1 Tax=Buchnera aphidicola (Hyadaphis tataricae) TaxID=1241859 RepID=A0A4D6Y4U7_9GAMM|nr:1-(5-phosphoribosyl)-5-[(5-phosphoribosylamino)methylideneamino]imidazole-4-carboxamide isomerase [Buchnera aphidicola]QCI21424.1 1-(5-phosphoribosyl)-5-[(5-phosphoribosylamino)methylideneamino]imidazole-4-carboxamide isomerase [Buchnera aphidicola (Hyadaphis tataricae)]